MSDLTYRLVVDLSTRGSLVPATEKLGKAGGDLNKVLGAARDTVGGIAGGLANAFTGAVEGAARLGAVLGAGAAAAGVAGLAYGVTHLNAEAEKAQVSIGAILSAQGMAGGVSEGIARAGELIKDMRRDAAQLPGEFKDLQSFFKLGLTPGAQLGASAQVMEKLSASAMAAAAATGVQMDQAAREFAQLLQGHAGGHNVFGQLLGFSGGEAAKFNALTGDARLKAIEGAVGKYQGSIEHYATTWDALSSTMVDNGKQMLQRLSAPIFTRAKEEMTRANEWFSKNEHTVGRFTDRMAQGLDAAFGYGLDHIKSWGPAMQSFAQNTGHSLLETWRKIEPMAERLEKLGQRALSDPNLMHKVGSVAGAYGAVKLGTTVGPSVISAVGSLGGAAGLSGAATGGLGALIMGLIAADIGSVGHVLTDSTAWMHDEAVAHWASMKEHFGSAFAHFGNALEKLEPIGVKIADLYGTWIVGQLDRAAYMLDIFAGAIERVAGGVASAANVISAKAHAFDKFAGLGIFDDEPGAKGTPRRDDFRGLLREIRDDDANARKTPTVKGGGGTHVQKVEIVVSSNQDPSRIARAIIDRISDVGRNPTSSRYVRNWGSSRP